MKILHCLVALAAWAVIATGQSKEWKFLDVTGDTVITGYFMYQPDGTVKTAEHTFKSWLKYGDVKKYTVKKMLFELRCDQREFRALAVLDETYKGKLLSRKFSSTSKWMDITPDSVNERFFTKICEEYDR